ncbi:MAG: uroporphyrinogen-III synthase [Pseudorhodobacter sp.]
MIPQSRRPAFLLTRPEAQGLRVARHLRAELGESLRIVTSPLLFPRLLHPDRPDGDFTAVIFTSQTGVAAASGMPGLPRQAFCVGHRTAEMARAAGFSAQSAGGAAEELIALVRQTGVTGRLLHLRGEISRGDVAQSLTAAGHPTLDLVVYAQVEQPLSSEARALLTGADPVIAPLFSPRTARIFARQWQETGGHAPLFLPVLSDAVASALPATLPARIFVATQPCADALMKASLAAYAAGQGS